MNIIIPVEFVPGTDIRDAVDQAINLAQKLDCFISFDFNGICNCVNSSSSPKRIVDKYLKSSNKRK